MLNEYDRRRVLKLANKCAELQSIIDRNCSHNRATEIYSKVLLLAISCDLSLDELDCVAKYKKRVLPHAKRYVADHISLELIDDHVVVSAASHVVDSVPAGEFAAWISKAHHEGSFQRLRLGPEVAGQADHAYLKLTCRGGLFGTSIGVMGANRAHSTVEAVFDWFKSQSGLELAHHKPVDEWRADAV